MAFEFRLSDTSPRVGQAALSPGSAGGVSPTRTYTPESIGVGQGVNVAETPFSQRPKFAQAENIQGLPARQDPPGPGISTTRSGGRGSVGNPIGNAIEGVGNKLAKTIRGTEFRPRSTTVEQFGGFEFPTPPSFPDAITQPTSSFFPTTSTTTAGIPSFLKEGGFIRKRT